MSLAITEKIWTVAEYFELEKNSDVRHEFYFGKLITMPGESRFANQISKNILKKWDDALDTQGYILYSHDVKSEINENKIYRYPDIVVTPESDDEDEYLVKKPVIMVEVASEDSWKRDTHNKRKEYTALETMQYYLIVSQEEMYVELHEKRDNNWISTQFEQENDEIRLPAFGLSITLKDIYYRVRFGDARTDA